MKVEFTTSFLQKEVVGMKVEQTCFYILRKNQLICIIKKNFQNKGGAWEKKEK